MFLVIEKLGDRLKTRLAQASIVALSITVFGTILVVTVRGACARQRENRQIPALSDSNLH